MSESDNIELFKKINYSGLNDKKDILNQLDISFYLILDRLSLNYNNFRKNPLDVLYYTRIDAINQELTNNKNDLFLLMNDLQNEISIIKNRTNILNNTIDEININNTDIENEYKDLLQNSSSSQGRLKEHKKIYKYKLYDLIFILILIIYILYSLYSKSNNSFSNIISTINIEPIKNISNIGNKIKDNIPKIDNLNIEKNFENLLKK